ncbi:MAG: hypothetical protein JXB06_08500 [Spirochaetales bacterium]|nr:hypothetical protein [Spirochaetales bacterium]
MNSCRVFSGGSAHAAALAAAAAVAAGAGLFFLIRLLEGFVRGSMEVNVLIEEGAKILVFLAALTVSRFAVLRRLLQPDDSGSASGSEARLPAALTVALSTSAFLCIGSFGIAENILFFLSFPTGSVYGRLLYSFPIHLNTALLYCLGFLSGRILRVGLFLGLGFLYHLGLNRLSLDLPRAAVYPVGIVNVVILLLLYWRLRLKIALGSTFVIKE